MSFKEIGMPFQTPMYSMTLRDYFAAKAMQGFAADPNFGDTYEGMASRAYEWADAMLKERAK